jgi:Fur family ferric uptake transcriptional regulator
MVKKHHFEDNKAVYEINSDEHHDHMVCVDTGQVMEFHDEDLEQLQHDIAEKAGYELVDHSMVLYVKKIQT